MTSVNGHDIRATVSRCTLQPYPVCVALGADPATILGAVTPVPASAEIVLEGHINPDASHASGFEHALEGPFGDHTGYYNEQDWFPVFTIDRITLKREPIYHSTYTGKPPDEPAMLGLAMNELFVPLLQRQYPATPAVSCLASGVFCASSCTTQVHRGGG